MTITDTTLAIGLVVAIASVVLLAVALILLVRARGRGAAPPPAPSSAPKPKPLGAVLAAFEKSLPRNMRGAPVAVVLGERLSGKSSLIDAALMRGGTDSAAVPSDTCDPRMSMHAGRGLIVLELAAELMEDGRGETRRALEKLLRPLALRIAVVALAVDAGASTYSPPGLRRLGARARELVDLLTLLRGRPPRLRLCLTHLDQRVDGFVEIAEMAAASGDADSCLPLRGRLASELQSSLGAFEGYLGPSLGTHSLEAIGRMARTLNGQGSQVLGTLEHCLEPLIGTRRQAAPPRLDGLVLAGLCPGRAEAMLGDPLSIDAVSATADLRMHERRRLGRTVTWMAAGAVVLAGVYGWHWRKVSSVSDAVRDFADLSQSCEPRPALDDAEARAASALLAAMSPAWPPLRAAFPKLKAPIDGSMPWLRSDFLGAVRRCYLLPKVIDPMASVRLRAVALIRADKDSGLGELVTRHGREFADALNVPQHIVEDYVRLSNRPWMGDIPNVPSAVEANACRALVDRAEPQACRLPGGKSADGRSKLDCDSRLAESQPGGRAVADPGPTSGGPSASRKGSTGGAPVVGFEDLQRCAAQLTASALDSLDAPADLEVLESLRTVSPGDAERLRAESTRRRVPEAIRKNGYLKELLDAFQPAKMNVPPVAGKTLSQALTDLAGMRCPKADDGHATLALPDGAAANPQSDKAAPPASNVEIFLARSRVSHYVRAFVADAARRKAPHALFFSEKQAFEPVGAADRLNRGARNPLPGKYTARAVDRELRPALTQLDATLDASCLADDARKELIDLVQKEVDSYAEAYRTALKTYLGEFSMAVTPPDALRSALEDMVGPRSWFGTFWTTLAVNSRVDAKGNPYLAMLADRLEAFRPLAALVPEKSESANVEPYYTVIRSILPFLEGMSVDPPESALEDRLSSLGRLGLKLVAGSTPGPLSRVKAWLDEAKLTQADMSEPFLMPLRALYGPALRELSATVRTAYTREVRPIIAPLWCKLPFSPKARGETDPMEVSVVLGQKGKLRSAFEQFVGPVVTKRRDGSYEWKPVREQQLASNLFTSEDWPPQRDAAEALLLARWADGVNALLFDAAGQPKPMALQVQPRPLARFGPHDAKAFSRSYLIVGDKRIEGFNQTPSWRSLGVDWMSSPPALVGVEVTDPETGDSVSRVKKGEGEAWQFLQLVCSSARRQGDVAEWELDATVSFRLRDAPCDKLVAPVSREACAAREPVVKVGRESPSTAKASPRKGVTTP